MRPSIGVGALRGCEQFPRGAGLFLPLPFKVTGEQVENVDFLGMKIRNGKTGWNSVGPGEIRPSRLRKTTVRATIKRRLSQRRGRLHGSTGKSREQRLPLVYK
jgi:hypothetical protein